MTALAEYKTQLVDAHSGANIATSGGTCYVATAGAAAKATLYNADGSSLANPISLTRGSIAFHVADTVASVDLFIMAPGGQFIVKRGIAPSGPNSFPIDTNARHQVAVIPFSAGDSTAAAETNTGFDMPLYAAVLPTPLLRVTTVDATETIDVGLLSSETAGDADGFMATVSVATLGLVKATVLQGSNTMGALFEVQDSANSGDLTHEAHVVTGSNATSITYTLTAGSDTAEGYILLPYILGAV